MGQSGYLRHRVAKWRRLMRRVEFHFVRSQPSTRPIIECVLKLERDAVRRKVPIAVAHEKHDSLGKASARQVKTRFKPCTLVETGVPDFVSTLKIKFRSPLNSERFLQNHRLWLQPNREVFAACGMRCLRPTHFRVYRCKYQSHSVVNNNLPENFVQRDSHFFPGATAG